MLEDVLVERLHDIANDGVAIGYGFSDTGTPTDHLCTYTPVWQNHYWRRELIYKDPVISFGARNLGAIRWHDADLSDPENAVYQAREFGMREGFVVSVQVDGERAIAGLATSSRPTDVAIKEARAILAALQATRSGRPKITLTPRQTEILRLIANGASAAAAARELEIDESTVNFHKREALQRNQSAAKNIKQLMAKAARVGLI